MSEGFAKVGLTLLILVGMFIPVYVFLGVNAYLEPVTFAEKALMIVGGYVVLGGLQLWFLFLGVVAILNVWSD